MLTNAEIKRIKSLKDKKFRDEYAQFAVEGEKLVGEALASAFKVEAVYREREIGQEAMSRMSNMSSPSPVLAVVNKPEPRPLILERGLYVALDSVRDPGNMGTILRLCDWFGVTTVFASMDSVEIYNPKVVQASMGSIFRVNTVYCDLPAVCKRFTDAGMPVYGTFLDGESIYSTVTGSESLNVATASAIILSEFRRRS